MAIATGHNIGKEIADALGIKHCRKLDIRIRTDEIVTVEAEYYPEIDGVKQLLPILKKYELCPLPSNGVNPQPRSTL